MQRMSTCTGLVSCKPLQPSLSPAWPSSTRSPLPRTRHLPLCQATLRTSNGVLSFPPSWLPVSQRLGHATTTSNSSLWVTGRRNGKRPRRPSPACLCRSSSNSSSASQLVQPCPASAAASDRATDHSAVGSSQDRTAAPAATGSGAARDFAGTSVTSIITPGSPADCSNSACSSNTTPVVSNTSLDSVVDNVADSEHGRANVMSFEEEDLDGLASMYDIISRASHVQSEERQQQAAALAALAEAARAALAEAEQQGRQIQPIAAVKPPHSPNCSSADSLSRASSSGSIAGSMSSIDLSSLTELQVATEKKLAALAHAVEELELGEEATQQLTDVLQKLEQLEQDLSAVVQSASSSDTQAAAAAIVNSPAPQVAHAAQEAEAAALAAAAAVQATAAAAAATAAAASADTAQGQPVAAAAAAAAGSSVAVAHTLEMEALAASASMGASAATPAALDALTVPAAAAAAAAAPTAADSTKLWPLFVLGLSYVHQATSGFALPALLPMISPELHLSDFQGAFLTSGYSYLYALALVPVGLLADKVDRPKLLAVGLALWSALSIVSSKAGSFGELLIIRTGFAIAQAAQNPVSFSLIPDLFPANKSTALAGYNCAIYLGRALSFASVLAAHRVGAAKSSVGVRGLGVGTMADAAAGNAADDGLALSMVPLDALDLQRMSIIYTTGDMAAVTPLYNYNFHVIAYEAANSTGGGWRELLTWIGMPGFAIALLMLLTVREPRLDNESKQQRNAGTTGQQGQGSSSSSIPDLASWREGASNLTTQLLNVATGHGWHNSSSSNAAAVELAGPACEMHLDAASHPTGTQAAGVAAAVQTASPSTAAVEAGASPSVPATESHSSFASISDNPISSLLKNKSFQATTIAAALNDVGSYALIAWHSTFYERVFGLDSGVYAPMLAVILPVGGILGGVGGGLIADWLSVVGGRYWLTAGASLLAGPFVAQSLLADDPAGSFTALLVGFALSEAWRAPGAIMIRSIAPQELGSTASALYLCIRNVIGGFGPVAVAKLAEVVGLQHAMLLAPSCYVLSGIIFLVAEKEIEYQAQLQQQQQQRPALQQQ